MSSGICLLLRVWLDRSRSFFARSSHCNGTQLIWSRLSVRNLAHVEKASSTIQPSPRALSQIKSLLRFCRRIWLLTVTPTALREELGGRPSTPLIQSLWLWSCCKLFHWLLECSTCGLAFSTAAHSAASAASTWVFSSSQGSSDSTPKARLQLSVKRLFTQRVVSCKVSALTSKTLSWSWWFGSSQPSLFAFTAMELATLHHRRPKSKLRSMDLQVTPSRGRKMSMKIERCVPPSLLILVTKVRYYRT